MLKNVVRRGAAAFGLTLALVVLAATAASAHVTVSPTEAPAGGYSVLTFAVPHGCDDAPTTQVKIQMPELIPQVTPTVNPNWEVEKVMETLDEPIEGGHGEQITERVAQVVYTAKTPLPDGLRDTFELSLQLPDTPGERVAFPVVQVCEGGAETAWIEIPDPDASEEPEHPAPVVEVTAAEGDGHGGSGDEAAEDGDAADAELASGTEEAAASDDGGDGDDGDGPAFALAIVAVGLGVVALGVGGMALSRSRSA